MNFLSINYDDFSQDSYEYISLKINNEEKRFASGDPVVDFRKSIEYLQKCGHTSCQMSSSCDHFVMDGDKYIWTDDGFLDYDKGEESA